MADPILPNRPQATKRYAKKYATGSDLLPFINGLNPAVSSSLRSLDEQRANLGQNPLNKGETLRAGTAANEQRKVTPEPKGNLFTNAAADVQTIAGSIPKLPAALFHELMSLPEIGSQLAELPETDTPFEALGNLAQLPGVRLLPGSFTASQFATDGPGVEGLAEHPVMTGLDLLPYASKAAKLTKTVKAAEELAKAESAVTLRPPTTVRPISTLLKNVRKGGPVTEMVDNFGTEVERLTPNKFGDALNRAKVGTKRTGAGGFLATGFSKNSRELSRVANRISSEIPTGKFVENDALVNTAREVGDEALKIADDFADVPFERQSVVSQAAEEGAPGWEAGFTPRELEFQQRLKTANDQLRDAYVKHKAGLTEVQYPHGTEVHITSDANKILKARHAVESQTFGAHLRDVLDPATPTAMTARQALDDLHTVLADTRLSAGKRRAVGYRLATVLEQQGHNMDVFRKELGLTKKANLPSLRANLTPNATDIRVPDHLVEGYLDTLKKLGRTDGTARELVHNIESGDWSSANKRIGTLNARTKFALNTVDLDNLQLWVKARSRSYAEIGKLEADGFTGKNLTEATREAANIENRVIPARFRVPANIKLRNEVEDYITKTYAGADLDKALASIDVDMGKAWVPHLKDLKKEIRSSWQDLQAQGYDPQFMHHVTESKASRAAFPMVMDFTPTLSQMKGRLWDSAPYVTNGAVALHSSALEYLIQQGSREFASVVTTQWAKPLGDLREAYLPAAREAFEKNPNITLPHHMQNLIDRDWKPFDPDSYINASKPPAGANTDTSLLVPKDVAANLEKLRPQPEQIGKLINPVMKVFRTSVLPLSPRWHVGNIFGGGLMTTLRAENPATVWKFAKRAYDMTKHEGGIGGLADELTGTERTAARMAPGGGATRQAQEWMRSEDLSTPAKKLGAAHDTAAGQTLRRLWDSAASERLRGGFNKGVQSSYDFNQFVDEFYKSMAYLEGKDKALIKGLSREEQIAAGMAKARESLANWDTITPMERSILRSVFPFYGWARQLMRYTMTYPVDHPWRMSIMANFANAEIQDGNSGLPARLQSLLFVGGEDADGNQTAVNLDVMNPFKDVANYFTMAGFLAGQGGDVSAVTGQLNPLLTSGLQAVGVDTLSGQQELFPELEYDAQTGGLKVSQQENPLLRTLGNIVPQTKLLGMLSQSNQEYAALARKNPQAAFAMLRSGLGLPNIAKQVNVPTEVMKAELTRYEQLRDDLNESLKSGNIGGFESRYPGLGSIQDRLSAMPASERAKYQIDPDAAGGSQPSLADLLKGALTPGVG